MIIYIVFLIIFVYRIYLKIIKTYLLCQELIKLF